MTQTREKWDSHALSRPDFRMVWRCHGIPWARFYFLSRTNGKIGHLDKKDFHHCYDCMVIFLKVPFWSNLITAMFKVPYQQWWGTLQQHFETTIELKILWTWIKISANSFNKTGVNIMKPKTTRVPRKLLVSQNSELLLQRTLHQNRCHLAYI